MSAIKIIIDILFDIGMFVNAVVYVPQIIKIFHRKEAKDLSLITFVSVGLLQLIVALHGYFYRDFALMVGMVFALLSTITLISLIIVYQKNW